MRLVKHLVNPLLVVLLSLWAFIALADSLESGESIQSAVRYLPISILLLVLARQSLVSNRMRASIFNIRLHLEHHESVRFYKWYNESNLDELVSVDHGAIIDGALTSSIERAQVWDRIFDYNLAGKAIFEFRDVLAELKGQRDLSHSPFMENVLRCSSLSTYDRFKIIFEPVLAAVLLILFFPIVIAVYLFCLVSGGSVKLNRKYTYSRNLRPTLSTELKLSSPLGLERFFKLISRYPDLVQILFGRFSFFGPRILEQSKVKEYIEKYPLFKFRFMVNPGLLMGSVNLEQKDDLEILSELKAIQRRGLLEDIKLVFS